MKHSKISKITIFGRPGSGKSTFAVYLHNKTEIPLYHLDKYFFVSNWEEQDYETFISFQESIVKQNSWIIDGNSLDSLQMRYQHAELVLFFNYSKWLDLLSINGCSTSSVFFATSFLLL